MTFQELFALMYYSEKPMKFLPLQDRFLDTIDQVIDSHHLEKMIQSNISDYLTVYDDFNYRSSSRRFKNQSSLSTDTEAVQKKLGFK